MNSLQNSGTFNIPKTLVRCVVVQVPHDADGRPVAAAPAARTRPAAAAAAAVDGGGERGGRERPAARVRARRARVPRVVGARPRRLTSVPLGAPRLHPPAGAVAAA